MPNATRKYKTTYSQSAQEILNTPLYDEPGLLMIMSRSTGIPQLLGIWDGPANEEFSDDTAPVYIPFAYADKLSYKTFRVDTKNFDPEAVKQDFREKTETVEKVLAQQIGPGDAEAWDHANALILNPAKRALNGWTNAKLLPRLNQAAWFKFAGAYGNLDFSEEGRKKMAWADVHFPLGRLFTALDRSTQRHVDYFDAKDKGELTAEDEESIRRALLEDELRVSQYLNRITGVSDPREGARIKELGGFGNPGHQFNRYAPRGLWGVCSDNEARITGLKNGWPIEDLNALSDMKIWMDVLYQDAMYTSGKELNPILRDKPIIGAAEKEFLTKTQELWARIEKTPVKDNETRMALLKEIRDVLAEGVEKGIIPTMRVSLEPEDNDYSYELADLDSKIARQLTPAEREVMESGKAFDEAQMNAFTQNINDEIRRREEEYEAAERRDREKTEQAQAAERLKKLEQQRAEEKEPDPRRYDEVRENIRSRRETFAAQEAEKNRFDPAEGASNWFFDVTAGERQEAYEAVPYGQDKAAAIQNDINRYCMGKNELSYDEALDMNVLLDNDERRMLAEQYYEDLKSHPVNGTDEQTAERNARYFGEIDAQALSAFLREDLKDFNPSDPVQVRELAEGKGRHGFISAFAGDMTRQMEAMLDTANSESAIRAGYAGAFGTRQELQGQVQRLMLADKLGALARLVQNADTPALSRTLALHSLQQLHAQMEGRSLADQDPTLALKAEAAYNAAVSAPSLPNIGEGAPTEREMELFLRGEIPSPFSQDYLKAQIEPVQNRLAGNLVNRQGDRSMGLIAAGTLDLGRIYNLDQIKITGPQPPIGPAIYAVMSGEQKEKAHRIFEQTLGNLIGPSSMQPVLSKANGEDLFDRFRIGGRKMSERMREIYGNSFDQLSPVDKERAMELELMWALTQAEPQVSYTPLGMDDQGRITERQPVGIPQVLPQRSVVRKAPTVQERLARRVARAGETAKKLNGILPKVFGAFEPDYLQRLTERPDMAGDTLKAGQHYLREIHDSSRILADMMRAGVGQDVAAPVAGAENPCPELTSYVSLVSNRIGRELDQNAPAQSLSYQALMGLVDAIHLPSADAPDEKRPGAVFRALSDHPDGDHAFPVIEAARTAEKMLALTDAGRAGHGDPQHPMAAEEEARIRREFLSEIATLEGHLDEMERVANRRARRQGLNQIFDGNALADFMGKESGINAIRSELEGRRTLILQGWPIEDTDYLSAFYRKRAAVKQALRNMPEGAERLSYERAEKALDEVCAYLDDTAVESADQRKEALQHIADFGPALFNDVIARTGEPDAGQPEEMKSGLEQLQAVDPPADAFVNAQGRDALAGEDQEFRGQIEENAEIRAYERTENRAMNEALAQGLFGKDEPAGEREAAGEAYPGMEEDIRDAMRFDEEELGLGVPAPQKKEKPRLEINDDTRAERERRQAAYERWDPNDTGSASFDWLFSDAEYKAAHPFDVEDSYLDSLQEDENYFGNLFGDAGRTHEEYDSEEAVKWDDVRGGFFDWADTKARLYDLQKNSCKDLSLKYTRTMSMNNDMRAWAMAEKGLTFEQAMELNNLDLRARKKIADEYLDTLAAHPLNPKMSPEAREDSARYYGEMHRKTYDRLAEMPFPELDVSNRETLLRMAFGPSALEALGTFVTDLDQDTEELFLHATPEVRTAYRDGLGGRERMGRAQNMITVLEGLTGLAQAAVSPVTEKSPLRNKAMAKFYLEMIRTQMEGKKLQDAPDAMGRFALNAGIYLKGVSLPEQGAPSDEELRAYLDGKAEAPFSDEYMERVNAALNERSARISTISSKNLPMTMAEGLRKGATVYDLPYIPMGKDMPRPQNISGMLPADQLHQTHVIFDRIFGDMLNEGSTSQVLFAGMMGRNPLDNFRIDGKKVTETVNLEQLMNTRRPEEVEAILEAEILQAYADPNRQLTYVPLALDGDGRAIEQAPLPLNVPRPFPVTEADPEPVQLVGGEALKAAWYIQDLHGLGHTLTLPEGLRPDEPLFNALSIGGIIQQYTYSNITETEEYDPGENGMDPGTGDLCGFAFRKGEGKRYALPRGTNADGTFTQEGRNNYDAIREQMNLRYDEMEKEAQKWDTRDPLLAEMLRFCRDTAATDERGYGYHELRNNGVYANLLQQMNTIHLGVPGPDHPYDPEQVMRAIQGYPTGDPYYPLPKAITGARRMALVGAMEQRSGQKDTLSRRQDRLNRRMYLAELDYTERQIEACDALYASTLGPDGHQDENSAGFARVSQIDKYLDNDVRESSRYHARGTTSTHFDSDARRMLISRGWPLRDLDMLAKLNFKRWFLREELKNPSRTPEQLEECRRGIKVLDEIYGILERTDIRSAADRKRVLDQIHGYGDLLFNDTMFLDTLNPSAKVVYRTEFEKMRERTTLAHEFLEEEELREARDTYERYRQARANVTRETDIVAATVNGPVSDAERAFLQAEHIGKLAVAQGQMEKNPAYAGDPVLLEARNHVETFMEGIEDFYKRHELLAPANDAQRKTAFEDLLGQSTDLIDALEQAEDKLTAGGSRQTYTEAEEKTLKEIRDVKKACTEMRRLYLAQLDYEMVRREDLAVHEANRQAEEALRQQEPVAGDERGQEDVDERERYMVDTEYALAMLSEADRQRLIDLHTRPEGLPVVFDVNTGKEIPPEPVELPDRVQLEYDRNGKLVPAAFIAELDADRRRSRAERRTAREQAEPDVEAAADLFGQFAGEEDAFYVRSDRTERHYEGIRRRREAERTGDSRYTWGFARILDDALAQKTGAEKDREQARNNPALTQAERYAFEEAVPDRNMVYGSMTERILGSYTPEDLERALASLRPQWYREVYLPAVEEKLKSLNPRLSALPETQSNVRRQMLKKDMTPAEYHRLLGELADHLPVEQREDLRERLLDVKPMGVLGYEEQVSYPLKGRINELRRVQVKARENEAPEAVEQRQRDYLEALEFAEKELDEVLPEVQKSEMDKAFSERDHAYRTARDADLRSVIGEKDPEYRVLAQGILGNPGKLISDGLIPRHEKVLHEMLDEPVTFAAEHKEAVAHLLRRMDEMDFAAMKNGEEGSKLYAYGGVAGAKKRLVGALVYGNPDDIIRARHVYEEKLREMRELTAYAKEHFSGESSPGNLDSTRNSSVPWEFASDFHASSQVNGVYQLYSALKRTGVSVEEYIADPAAATRRMYETLDKERTLTSRLAGRSIGESLGILMAETEKDRQRKMGNDAAADMMINRSLNFMVEADPDPARRRENRTREKLYLEHHTELNRIRELNRNPFLQADAARGNEVMRLLSVVSAEDLAANTERMLNAVPMDSYGKKLAPITTEQYIAGLKEVDYYRLVDRSADVIRDAMKVEGTLFDAAEFLKERQKALSMLLTARPGDAGRQGYDLLEYEIMHMAEYYDMLREANPQMELPALSQAQRQAFADAAAQYEARRRQVQQNLPQEQKRAIARLRKERRAAAVPENFRIRTLGREANRNRADEAARLKEERKKDREVTAAVQIQQRRMEEERLRREASERVTTERIRQQVERHVGLDLTRRLDSLIGKGIGDRRAYQTEYRRVPSDPQRVYDTDHLAQDSTHRADELLAAAIAAYHGSYRDGSTKLTREELSTLLSVELGDDRAAQLMKKMSGGLVDSRSLDELTDAERGMVLGALAGAVPEDRHADLLRGDDHYLSFEERQLQGIIDDPALDEEARARRRAVFESQVRLAGPGHDEIERIRREIGGDWSKYSGGKGTQEDLRDFRAVLDEADVLLRRVDPRIRSYQDQEMLTRMEYLGTKEKRMAAPEYEKEENRYIPRLTAGRNAANEFRPPAAEETQDIKKLQSEKMVFGADYIRNVAGMLRRMEELKILKENSASEEDEKVYGFHRLRQAHQDLMEAFRSNDPERIKNAVAAVKERRREMDELYAIAAKSFHKTDYKINLDLVRNDNIPWEYARDLVTTSQINSMYILGSCLKESGISIDEFEKDPGAAIQKMNAKQYRDHGTLTSFAEGKSLGTLTGDLASGYATASLNKNAVEYNFKLSRGLQGLILADPGDPHLDPQADLARKNRNYMVSDGILRFNGRISDYHQVVNNECLLNGMKNQSQRGREVLRTMMIVDERDVDVERMFTEVPIGADRTRLSSFSLSGYLTGRQEFDYQAQKNRMESIMTDAIKEVKRLDSEFDRLSATGNVDKSFDGFRSRNFRPLEILRARQEALFELLTLRSHERNKPGFAELEKELREMPARYDELRKAHPELGLPALKAAEKQVLESMAVNYDNFLANRTKSMEIEEKRIAKEVETQEKAFDRSLKNANKEVERRRERMQKLIRRGAPHAEIDAAEQAYVEAYTDRGNRVARRALAIADDYREGKLPEAYAAERLKQLSELSARDFAPVPIPPLFGTPAATPQAERLRLRNRERFLVPRLLEEAGFKVIEPKADVTDAMRASLAEMSVPQAQQVQQVQPEPQAAPIQPQVQQVQPEPQAAPMQPQGQQVQQEQPGPGPQIVQNAGGGQLGDGDGQAQPKPQVRRWPDRRKTIAPKVQDMGLADLINKVGGDNGQPEHRSRRNSVSGEQNRPQLDRSQQDQNGPQGHGANRPNNMP